MFLIRGVLCFLGGRRRFGGFIFVSLFGLVIWCILLFGVVFGLLCGRWWVCDVIS